MPEFQAMCIVSGNPADAPDVRVTVLLGGQDVVDCFDVEKDSMGCICITSGPFTSDLEETGYNRNLMVAMSLRPPEHARDMLDDGEHQDKVLEIIMGTLAHELVHIANFINVGGGLTPHEIFLNEGEEGIYRVASMVGSHLDPLPQGDEDEDDPYGRKEGNEMRVEGIGRRWTADAMRGLGIDHLVVAAIKDMMTQLDAGDEDEDEFEVPCP